METPREDSASRAKVKAKAKAKGSKQRRSKPATRVKGARSVPSLPLLSEYWATFEDSVRANKDRGLVGMSTGFEKFDRLLCGLRGLVVLGGEPGVGKTVFALNVALHAAKSGVPVVFGAFEMPRHEMYARLVSILSETPFSEVQSGPMSKKSEAEKAKAEVEKISPLFRLVSKGDGCSIEDLFRLAEGLQGSSREKRAFVVVDSLQKYCGTKVDGAKSEKQALDLTIGAIGNACEKYSLDALVISHVPKSSKDSTGVFMFMGSAGIDFEADVTMSLSTDDDHPDKRHIRLSVIKNRYGQTGEVDLVLLPPLLKFEER